MFHYHYVFFNSLDGSRSKTYPDGYNTICAHDLTQLENVEVVSAPVYFKSKVIRCLYALHNSDALNNKINLPLKHLWFPYYFKSRKSEIPFCFIFLMHKFPIDYLGWLKKHYPNCRIVLLHRDLKQICFKANPLLPDNPLLDLEMTYDKVESEQFGYPWFSEYESKIDIPLNDCYPESDVFFAGRAKDRLPKLLEAYEEFRKAGLTVFYYLTGVDVKERIELPGIVYAENNMSYKHMLEHTVNTRCVFEINYGNTEGYTSRFLESVIYGKKLITNNPSVKKTAFYKSGNIKVIENMKDIDTSFITEGSGFVDYNYKGEFSPVRMLERVDDELIKKYGVPSDAK